jgi:hypothetical protein
MQGLQPNKHIRTREHTTRQHKPFEKNYGAVPQYQAATNMVYVSGAEQRVSASASKWPHQLWSLVYIKLLINQVLSKCGVVPSNDVDHLRLLALLPETHT